MILTAIAPGHLPGIIAQFASFLDTPSRAVFRRIADPAQALRANGEVAARHHATACDLATEFGMALLPGSPALDFAWNGQALRSATEAYVLVHEVAHFQLAPPARRRLIDFGLGAGPETGDRATAEHAATVFGLAREAEEAMASLLGVLWEVELGQPGFASFLDQNWLEGAERPGATAHFRAVLAALLERQLVDGAGRPQKRLANMATAARVRRSRRRPRSVPARATG
jgi:elongation factor P hydroxylase